MAKRHGRSLSKYIEHYEIEDPQVRKKIALQAAATDGIGVSEHIWNYHLPDRQDRLDVFRVAFRQNLTRQTDVDLQNMTVQQIVAALCHFEKYRDLSHEFDENTACRDLPFTLEDIDRLLRSVGIL